MGAYESLRDVENLRFRVQMNNRLRLECLAAVSKVFREFGEPIKDELLSSIVFALPQELISSNGHDSAWLNYQAKEGGGNPPDKPEKEKPEKDEPGLPPGHPKEQPGLPPPGPAKPGLPPKSPTKPGLPPSEPLQAPALPPNQPEQAATQYIAQEFLR